MYCISFSVYMPQVVYTHALLTSQGLYLFPAAAAEFVTAANFSKHMQHQKQRSWAALAKRDLRVSIVMGVPQ